MWLQSLYVHGLSPHSHKCPQLLETLTVIFVCRSMVLYRVCVSCNGLQRVVGRQSTAMQSHRAGMQSSQSFGALFALGITTAPYDQAVAEEHEDGNREQSRDKDSDPPNSVCSVPCARFATCLCACYAVRAIGKCPKGRTWIRFEAGVWYRGKRRCSCSCQGMSHSRVSEAGFWSWWLGCRWCWASSLCLLKLYG